MSMFLLNRNLLISAALVGVAALASPAVSAADGDPAQQMRERMEDHQEDRTRTDAHGSGSMQEKMERERLRDESQHEGDERKRMEMEKRDHQREDMKMKKDKGAVEDHLRRGKSGNR